MSLDDFHPKHCPEFEYKDHPNRAAEIPRRVAQILKNLRLGNLDSLAAASDTRSVHGALFFRLTPPGYDYYAGHYRGEEYPCLRRYPVFVGGRPGWYAGGVPGIMEMVGKDIGEAIAALDAGHKHPDPPEVKLLHTVQVACRFFNLVCWVHPYANGNGHAARFCLWAILVRYGYFPVRWPIEPRPPEPQYTDMLHAYRAGKHEVLERHVLSCIG